MKDLEKLAVTERDTAIFALGDSLYIKSNGYGDIEICTNNRDKQSYWELKQLQERISALLNERGVYYEPISASDFLGKKNFLDSITYRKASDNDFLAVKLRSRATYKLFSRRRKIIAGSISGALAALCAAGLGMSIAKGNAVFAIYSCIGGLTSAFGAGISYMADNLFNNLIPISTTKYIKQLKNLNKNIEREQEIIDHPEKYNRNKIIASEKNKDKFLAKKK